MLNSKTISNPLPSKETTQLKPHYLLPLFQYILELFKRIPSKSIINIQQRTKYPTEDLIKVRKTSLTYSSYGHYYLTKAIQIALSEPQGPIYT